MITRTATGYALNGWEGRSISFYNDAKVTTGEARAATCHKNGMSQKEAAKQLHCSVSNIRQYWQSIYYKLHTNDVVVALDKLSDLGVLVKLSAIFSMLINWAKGYDGNPNKHNSRPQESATHNQHLPWMTLTTTSPSQS